MKILLVIANIFISGVNKASYGNSINVLNQTRSSKISPLLDVGYIYVVSDRECCLENYYQLFPHASTQVIKVNYWSKSFSGSGGMEYQFFQ